jgi:hypothetical protein
MDAPFEVIMQQAAKLKTDQMAPNRRKYDASPMWYQHSLFSVDAIIKARDTLSFPELYQYGVDLKDIGNLEYKEGNMLGAMNEYEKALSLFKWLKPLREDWKKRVCMGYPVRFVCFLIIFLIYLPLISCL